LFCILNEKRDLYLAISVDNMPVIIIEIIVEFIESGLPQEDIEVELFWGRDELFILLDL
jgi:hypothetical protein